MGDTLAEDVNGTTSILGWYDSSRPMWIDLVGDYAGRELFLVEGDSLLRICFEDERLDFDNGFQLLHAVYIVERFLENLVKRHCQFHIAFFESHEELCVPPGVPAIKRSRYLLARAAIKRHLTQHLPVSQSGVVINAFPSLSSEEWKEYLHISPIHFIMSHDGGVNSTNKTLNDATEADNFAKILFRGMIWWFNSHKLNVALINRIEFRDSKVFTMIVESFTRSSKLKLFLTTRFIGEIKHTWKEFGEALGDEEEDGFVELSISEANLSKVAKAISEAELTERSYISAYSAAGIIKQDPSRVFMASALVLHSLTLEHLPLRQRRLPMIIFNEDFEKEIDEFLASIARLSREIIEDPVWVSFIKAQDIESDETDLIDGRLFRVIIKAMVDNTLNGIVPEALKDDWIVLCDLVKDLSGQELSFQGGASAKISNLVAVDDEPETSSFTVLPFSNAVFDNHLECIHVKTDASLPVILGSMKVYRETTHWHNYKKPLISKVKVAEKVSKWRNPLRTNQFYMNEMTNYAASLTGAKGKALDAETITVGPKRLIKLVEEKPSEPEKAEKGSSKSKKETQTLDSKAQGANAKKGTKKAASGLSKKEQMKADNTARKGSTESDKTFVAWTNVMKDFDLISDNQDRYIKTKRYLDSLDSTKTAYLEADILTYILQCLLNWWAGYCKSNTKKAGYHVVALIWTTVRSIYASKSNSKEIDQHATKVCKLLGITDAYKSLTPAVDRKLSFVFKYPTQNLQIDVPQFEFQLDYCGPYMDRMLDAKPDPRVSSFIPDGWQRDVLDQLDANKSVFVVAPTSAGKTFISFYAMEQILRADNDGVLVYVAPTKALVNQIAAEVQGRFSKKFPLAGKGVWAIHTRDYRVNNPTGCQILVTVPHILQIMLLSPSNAKSWAPRVKRIIFDEIHCIGQAEDGVVWEQLLLLAPCPIIALSATIGNPEQFNDWLMETQKAAGFELKMIQHSTRYSDLRKYMYEPPHTFKFTALGKSYGVGLGLDGLEGFEGFHPVSSLIDKSRGMPDDLALEPRDCLSLWKAMIKFQTDAYKVPESLNPAKSLLACIRKVDIFAWEKDLKNVLLKWMGDRNSPFDKVVAELTPVEKDENKNQNASATSSVTDGDVIDPVDLKATSLPLLLQLHKRRALPAILFNYDRAACENIAYAILGQLVEAEAQWKEGPQWKKLYDGYEKYLELKDKKTRKLAKPAKKANKDDEDEGGSKTDRMRDESSDGASIYDLFDPEAPQADFSFSDPKQLQKQDLAEYIRQLRRKEIKEELIELLRRGIGVHHAGMNRKYRQCVEMLFRKGFLRVVIATGTLSLGINMPCATVVFSGDSVFLTALNFRQAAGRSGRRGFDLLGNVVFQGVSRERASRLLSSRLPELTGHFPITTTLVLRLFTLLNDSQSSPYAVKAINSLLSQPRLYLGGKSFKEQVLHHLRFSIEYLRRNQLLGPAGQPINFTSCVSHLYFTENSSFAFHALLRGGYFHKLCADIDTNPEIVLRTMILVLSHLFGRQAVREVDDPEEREKIKRSPSNVYLEPMPKEAAAILRNHNKDTLDIFTTYVKTFAEQHIKEEERALPLTRTIVGPTPVVEANGKASNGHANGGVHKENIAVNFLPSLSTPYARSSFDALSGHGDTFSTIEDLCSSTREGVFLESAVIPHLVLHPEETRSPLNAYLLDFFKHGAVKPLEDANGIRKSDVWFVLNDFSMVLATIVTSLALYIGLGNSDDPEMLDVMGTGDAAENDADEEIAAASVPLAPPATTTIINTQQALPARKKKVVDDWDAGEDALVEEENYLKTEGQNGVGATDGEEYEKLLNVYKAFRKLKTEFDEKFRAIWA